jgi:hypothetical protein
LKTPRALSSEYLLLLKMPTIKAFTAAQFLFKSAHVPNGVNDVQGMEGRDQADVAPPYLVQ